MKNNIVAIIQARLGSSRFPGKMLKTIQNRLVIEWTVRQVSKAKTVDLVVVATTDSKLDNALAEWCEKNNVAVFRGSEDDVLDRFYQCARHFDATHVMRITGDNPLQDPHLLDEIVELAIADPEVDYANNVEPMTYPEGIGTEVLPFHVLERAWREATLPSHREHVTPYVRFHTEWFKHAVKHAESDMSHYRLTVDYKEDIQALENLLHVLAERGQLETIKVDEVVAALADHPEIQNALGAKQGLWRQEVASDEGRSLN